MRWMIPLGVLLIGASLLDIFLTVLYARSGAGVLAPVLSKGLWRLFRLLSRPLGDRRGILLSFAGPVALVAIAAQWLLLLVTGFALVFWPELGTGVRKSSGPTPTDFLTALYYSGFSLSTLGVGDLVPESGGIRVLTIIEAALGFSFFTLTITYFLSVYSALQRRNTLASVLHHKTSGSGDPRLYVLSLAQGGNLSSVSQELGDLASRTADLVEAHTFYPVLHYFHFRHLRYGLPRMAFILMDTAALIKTLPLAGRDSLQSAASQVETATRDLLERLAEDFLTQYKPVDYSPGDKEVERWRTHYREAFRTLAHRGAQGSAIPQGEENYIETRRKWHPFIAAFSDSLGYELDQVVPAPELPA